MPKPAANPSANEQGYSLVLEILSALPHPPAYAKLADLARDFGLPNQHAVRDILRGTSLKFEFGQADGAYVVWCDEWDWCCMQPKLKAYWNKVHGA